MRHLALAFVFFAAVPGALAQDYSEDHLQAAEELLSQIDMQTLLETTTDEMLRTQMEQSPELLPFEDIMRSFLQKYIGWQNLKERFVRIYAEVFTEEELREITAFYQTETGRKAAELTPVLMSRGMAIGEEIVAEHTPELEQMLQERARELNGSN